MDLTLTEEQRLLADTARAVVTRDCPLDVVRMAEVGELGYDAGLRKTAGALGWAGLVLPETSGGSGRGLLDLVVLAEELGRGLFPTPLLPSTIAALALAWSGSDKWLPSLAAGETIVLLAMLEQGDHDEWVAARARVDGDGRVTGTKTLVPYAAAADLLLVVVDGPALVVVDPRQPGVVVRRLHVVDGEPRYEVAFSGARGEVVSKSGAAAVVLDRALDYAAVASLAFVVGAAERVVTMTVEHACTREQFGRAIGSFQAVAHRCVDIRTDLDACRLLAYQAAWALDRGGDASLEVGAAKAWADDALRRVFQHTHQVHGAIGFSTEHDLHLFTRRAKAFELTYGTTARHRERVAVAMGL